MIEKIKKKTRIDNRLKSYRRLLALYNSGLSTKSFNRDTTVDLKVKFIIILILFE